MRLPSRYEDLQEAYKGRLLPNKGLIDKIKSAVKSIEINGGIRFLPVYGESGSGKSSATIELKTHLPETHTFLLEKEEISDKEKLIERILHEYRYNLGKILIPIVDQF
ncbi:hypothetical protein, partial [Chryseobacterium arthrosphaerae]